MKIADRERSTNSPCTLNETNNSPRFCVLCWEGSEFLYSKTRLFFFVGRTNETSRTNTGISPREPPIVREGSVFVSCLSRKEISTPPISRLLPWPPL